MRGSRRCHPAGGDGSSTWVLTSDTKRAETVSPCETVSTRSQALEMGLSRILSVHAPSAWSPDLDLRSATFEPSVRYLSARRARGVRSVFEVVIGAACWRRRSSKPPLRNTIFLFPNKRRSATLETSSFSLQTLRTRAKNQQLVLLKRESTYLAYTVNNMGIMNHITRLMKTTFFRIRTSRHHPYCHSHHCAISNGEDIQPLAEREVGIFNEGYDDSDDIPKLRKTLDNLDDNDDIPKLRKTQDNLDDNDDDTTSIPLMNTCSSITKGKGEERYVADNKIHFINVGTNTEKEYQDSSHHRSETFYKLWYTSKHHVWLMVEIYDNAPTVIFTIYGNLHKPIKDGADPTDRYTSIHFTQNEMLSLCKEDIETGDIQYGDKKLQIVSDNKFTIFRSSFRDLSCHTTIPIQIDGAIHQSLRTIIHFINKDLNLMTPFIASTFFGGEWFVKDKRVFKRLVIACARYVYEITQNNKIRRMPESDRAEVALASVTQQTLEHFCDRSGLTLDRTFDVSSFHKSKSKYAAEIASGVIPPTSRRLIHNAQCDTCSLNARARTNPLFDIEIKSDT